MSLAVPASAGAVANPEEVIAPGSDWYSGSLIQQPGQNCSTAIIGEPYTEIMISGVGSYGGAASGGVVNVNENYYAELLVSVPGNPCGSGSSSVATDLVLPAHTSYDPSRQIRCWGTNRFSDDFFEVTNQSWNYLGHTGRYCPTGTNTPASGIGKGFGFRPLANGQMFVIFVPLKTTQELTTGADEFNWLTTASAAYANPGRSYSNAWVFPAGGGGTPYVYFSRDPSAIPFWLENPTPPGTENRVEFFANLYSAGEGGCGSGCYLHYEIRRTDNNALIAEDADDTFYNGTVPSSPDSVQVNPDPSVAGPNGGYVPFAYTGLENVPMKISWWFTYDFGASQTPPVVETFRTLSGPDLDHDGIGDNADACPGVQGTLANGCLPVPKMDGSTGVKKGAKVKRKGKTTIALDCNLASSVSAKLTVKRGLAKNLGVVSAGGVRIGGGKSTCKPAADNKVTLKLTPKAKRKLGRRGKEKASLIVVFTRTGSSQKDQASIPVKISG